MRIMPFMKRKKGVQFAGIGLDTGGGGGGSYVLPPATSNTLGGVKVGTGLEVTEDGILSSSGGGGVNYSTTRQDTGIKDINGDTVYSKTIVQNITGDKWFEITVDTGIKAVIDVRGTINAGTWSYLIGTNGGNGQSQCFWNNSGTVQFTVKTTNSGTSTVRVTVFYTLN